MSSITGIAVNRTRADTIGRDAMGDTYFYSEDFPKHSATLEPAGCPLFVFSGEYDYSASLEMSREAAARLGGELVEMKTKGHFPMAEDPIGFAEYLNPVLARIAETGRIPRTEHEQ